MSVYTAYTLTVEGKVRRVPAAPPQEAELDVHVNGDTLVRLACTPRDLKPLALGFLYTTGLIQSLDDVEEAYVNTAQSCVDIWLRHWLPEGARLPHRPSGCAGGLGLTTEVSLEQPLPVTYRVELEALGTMMRALLGGDAHQGTRALHISGLFTPQGELVVAMQDLGRHNTLDKIAGYCLLEGLAMEGGILLTSGRIASEMVVKAARLRVPVLGSLKAVTTRAIALAQSLGLTTVGYVSRRDVRVYTHPQRIFPVEWLEEAEAS